MEGLEGEKEDLGPNAELKWEPVKVDEHWGVKA